MIEVFVDGSSLGNPGRAGSAFLIYKDKKLVKKDYLFLGEQTNNFAEYMAFILALCELLKFQENKITIFSDSELVCRQLAGRYKVRNKNIIPLFSLAKKLLANFSDISIKSIPRGLNHEADKLAKEAAGCKIGD